MTQRKSNWITNIFQGGSENGFKALIASFILFIGGVAGNGIIDILVAKRFGDKATYYHTTIDKLEQEVEELREFKKKELMKMAVLQ